MTNLNYALIFFLCMMLSCNAERKFDKEIWLKSSDVNDTKNPRAHMTKDLLENRLKTGITRDSVMALLGKPYKEGIEVRLPKGMEIPDSLSFSNKENLKQKNNGGGTDRIDAFIRLNAQPDTLMLYPVGWSIIDPIFLVIKLDNKGMAADFWIEEH